VGDRDISQRLADRVRLFEIKPVSEIDALRDEAARLTERAETAESEREAAMALLREARDELDPHGTRDGRPIVHQHIIDLQARINAALARKAER
jgi:hypothetical protein